MYAHEHALSITVPWTIFDERLRIDLKYGRHRDIESILILITNIWTIFDGCWLDQWWWESWQNARLLSAPRASAAPQLNNLDAFERLKRGDVEQERIWIIGLLHQGSNPRKIPMQSSLFTPQRIKLVNFSLFCLRQKMKCIGQSFGYTFTFAFLTQIFIQRNLKWLPPKQINVITLQLNFFLLPKEFCYKPILIYVRRSFFVLSFHPKQHYWSQQPIVIG